MIFKLKFYPIDRENENIIHKACICYGLKDLDELRLKFPKYKITHDMIRISCLPSQSNWTIELTEEQARKCLVFYDNNSVTVHVPQKSLNRFLINTYTPDFVYTNFLKIPIKKKIIKINIDYEIDADKLISKWCEHGCPVVWDPSAQDGSCSPELLKIYEKNHKI